MLGLRLMMLVSQTTPAPPSAPVLMDYYVPSYPHAGHDMVAFIIIIIIIIIIIVIIIMISIIIIITTMLAMIWLRSSSSSPPPCWP